MAAAALAAMPVAHAKTVCHSEPVQAKWWYGSGSYIGNERECGLPARNRAIKTNRIGGLLYRRVYRRRQRINGVVWTLSYRYLGGPEAIYTGVHGREKITWKITH